jgi:hypothetical protein
MPFRIAERHWSLRVLMLAGWRPTARVTWVRINNLFRLHFVADKALIPPQKQGE